MVILCSLLPDLFCPIINLLKKKCYHGTQCSAGDMSGWQHESWWCFMWCWTPSKHSLGLFCSRAAGVSAGDNRFKWNRTAGLAQISLDAANVRGGCFASLRSGQISEFRQRTKCRDFNELTNQSDFVIIDQFQLFAGEKKRRFWKISSYSLIKS